MAKHWIAKAINPAHRGYLRKALSVRGANKIPRSKLRAAAKGNSVTARRARLAITLSKFRKR